MKHRFGRAAAPDPAARNAASRPGLMAHTDSAGAGTHGHEPIARSGPAAVASSRPGGIARPGRCRPGRVAVIAAGAGGPPRFRGSGLRNCVTKMRGTLPRKRPRRGGAGAVTPTVEDL